MESRIGRMLETLNRVDGMIASRPELSPVVESEARRELVQVIDDLNAYVTHQDHAARASLGETARKDALLQSLLIQMRALAGAAKRKLRKSPEFAEFRMPRSGTATENVLSAASGMIAAARKHEAALAQAGLGANFVERLVTAANNVRQSLNGRADHRGTRSNATAALRALAGEVAQVLTVLDAHILPLIAAHPGLIAEWKAAKRIGRKPGARTAAPPAAAAQTPEVQPA